jgi:predicted nucleic-acid-binding Zn-ribbon protein
MKRTNQCPKCSSRDVIADAKALDRCEDLRESEFTVATYRNPEALLFKGRQSTTLSAWVCADCGYVEFYADSPRSINIATD